MEQLSVDRKKFACCFLLCQMHTCAEQIMLEEPKEQPK